MAPEPQGAVTQAGTADGGHDPMAPQVGLGVLAGFPAPRAPPVLMGPRILHRVTPVTATWEGPGLGAQGRQTSRLGAGFPRPLLTPRRVSGWGQMGLTDGTCLCLRPRSAVTAQPTAAPARPRLTGGDSVRAVRQERSQPAGPPVRTPRTPLIRPRCVNGVLQASGLARCPGTVHPALSLHREPCVTTHAPRPHLRPQLHPSATPGAAASGWLRPPEGAPAPHLSMKCAQHAAE